VVMSHRVGKGRKCKGSKWRWGNDASLSCAQAVGTWVE
jgi:hypothetical protein